ncbi:MAG: zinc-binding alcohol dehydrogenase family protein [Lacunisphaera sp.]|nr:zinc-binding alcohol dehydrogenase family protein [Lacunisphaera sp.]
MQALQIISPGQTAVISIYRPEPRSGEILLQIRRAGLCGSDLSTYCGANPLVSYPRIPGHELAGTVVAVGAEVPSSLTVGTEVLVLPYTSCGSCSACRQGRPNTCRNNQTLGVQREGGIAEFLTLPWGKVMAAPGLSFAELALVEPLTVGFHAVSRGRVTATDTVVVLGCGAIGLGAIAGAAARRARVIAVDLDTRKLALARRLGATETIDNSDNQLALRLQDLTHGDGPEVVIEAIGIPATFQAAVEIVGVAGRVVYIGYAKAPVQYETRLFVQKELDILGSRNALPADFAEVVRIMQSGVIPTSEIVSQVVPLAEAGAALAAWSDRPGDTTKIQIEMPG